MASLPVDNAAAIAEVEQLLADLKGDGGAATAAATSSSSAGDPLRRLEKIRSLLQTPAETMKFQNTCVSRVPPVLD